MNIETIKEYIGEYEGVKEKIISFLQAEDLDFKGDENYPLIRINKMDEAYVGIKSHMNTYLNIMENKRRKVYEAITLYNEEIVENMERE